MKHCRSASRPTNRFIQGRAVLLGAACVLLMSSCNKMSELVDRIKDMGGQGSSHSTVDAMNQKEAQALIANESKLVMVEFYTDT